MARDQMAFNGLKELRSHLTSVGDRLNRVFILFTGNKSQPDGLSWCPDCNTAEPVIHASLKLLDNDQSGDQFLTCYVGDRASWKDAQNEFRLDREFKLTCIPTLIQWKTNKVLREEQCANESLVQMLFEKEDD